MHRTCSVACPVCKQAARWATREEQDNELNTVYAYLECPKCGLRSREVISLKPERKALEKEWPLVGADFAQKLELENRALRAGCAKIAASIGNGSAISPDASVGFLTNALADEVKLYCHDLRRQMVGLRREIQHQKNRADPTWPTDEEIEQFVKEFDEGKHQLSQAEINQCQKWSPVGFGGSSRCERQAGHHGQHRAPMGLGMDIEWGRGKKSGKRNAS